MVRTYLTVTGRSGLTAALHRPRVRPVWLPVGGAARSTAKDFDVRRHVRRIALPQGDFTAHATDIAGELMERPLERGLPPWEMYVRPPPAPPRSPYSSSCTTPSPTACAPSPSAPASSTRSRARGAGARRERGGPPRSWLPGPHQVAGFARDRIEEVGRAVGIGASVMRASRFDLWGDGALASGSSGTRRLGTAVLAHDDVLKIRRVAGGTVNDVLLAVVAGALLADHLPPLAHRFGAPLAGSAARMLFDVLVTSVPLPRSALSLGGSPLRAIYPMALLARGQSLAVALSTYGGQVHVGLVADAEAVPDLDRLAGSVSDEPAALLRAATG